MAPMDDGSTEVRRAIRQQHQRLRAQDIAAAHEEKRANSNSATLFPDPHSDQFRHRARDDEEEDDDDGDDGTVTSNANNFSGNQNSFDDDDNGFSRVTHGHVAPLQIFPPNAASSTSVSTVSSKLSRLPPSSTLSIPIMVPSFFPTTVSLPSLSTTLPLAAFTSSQYQKGLDTDDYDSSTTFSTTITNTAATPTALADVSGTTNTAQLRYHHDRHHKLGPLAQHLLIAAGAVGVFIIIVAGFYLVFRLSKSTVVQNRQFRKRGRKGWYGWRKMDEDQSLDPPPKYTGPEEYYGKSAEEKSIPAQRQLDAFFSPVFTPRLATTNAALSRADSQRQNLVREALQDNPEPFAFNATPQQHELSATEAFYGFRSQRVPEYPRIQIKRQPSDAQGNTLDTQTSTQNVLLSHHAASGESRRETKYMSYLSSLSSGFGDGLIIPEESLGPTTSANANARASPRQSRSSYINRISWGTSAPGTQISQGDRDTIYTTSSVDSAPRFRTVNSWVAQQSSQLGRKRQSDKEIPQMPMVPLPLRVASIRRRETTENPAFQFHPGDELIISRGSRVPSEILDKKLRFPRR